MHRVVHRARSCVAIGAILLTAACGSTVVLNGATQSATGSGVNGGLVQDQPTDVAPSGETSGQSPTEQAGPSGPQASATALPGGQSPTGTGSTPSSPTTSGSGFAGPAYGKGYNEKEVYVGISIESDAAAIGSVFGFKGFDYGDQEKTFNAAIDMANERGGVYGRKIRPVYYDVGSTTDPAVSAEKACTKWTQDHRVAVVILGVLATDQIFQCLYNAHIPVLTNDGGPRMINQITKYYPYLLFSAPTAQRFSAPLVDGLSALNYFSGWNTTTGQPGNAPVKIGIVHKDDPNYADGWAFLGRLLTSRHYSVTEVAFDGSEFTNLSSSVLKLKAQGVTHVLLDGLSTLAFPSNAENQKYRPRYGVSTFSNIQPFMVTEAPRAQLNGLSGIGWAPMSDVLVGQYDPAKQASSRECLAGMKKRGLNTAPRNYQLLQLGACDGIQVFVEGARRARTFLSPQFVEGTRAQAQTMVWRTNFGLRTTANDPSLVGFVRRLQWSTACSCVQYVGGNVAI